MRKQRKREAEERQRQIAQTIRYISWGLITVTSLGGFSLLHFFTEFLRGLRYCEVSLLLRDRNYLLDTVPAASSF